MNKPESYIHFLKRIEGYQFARKVSNHRYTLKEKLRFKFTMLQFEMSRNEYKEYKDEN